MILLDIPPPFFSDSASNVFGIVFFSILVAVAIISYKRLESKVNDRFRLIIVATILIIAVIGSLTISLIIPQISYTNPYVGNRPNNRSR